MGKKCRNLIIAAFLLLAIGVLSVSVYPKFARSIEMLKSSYNLLRQAANRRSDILTTAVPVSSKGTRHYAQGGIVADGVAYFTADHGNIERGDHYVKSERFPYVVAFTPRPPFTKTRAYAFKDTYDSAPLYLTTKDGAGLLLAHEYKQKRTKAINVRTGNTEWLSKPNQPGNLFFAYSYCAREDNSKIVLGAFRNGLHALNLINGRELWHIRRQATGGVTPCVDPKNQTAYYQYDKGLLKVDCRTGNILNEVRVAAPNTTISWNTVLVDDDYGYYIATYWYGAPQWDSAVRVYDKDLKLVWEHTSLPAGKKATLTYVDGKIITGIGNGWSEKYCGEDWKILKAWSIADGSVSWQTDLSGYGFLAIYNVPYFNGYVYAETQDTYGFTSKLFKIKADDGTLESVLDYGRPLTSCAPPIIANGMMFSGDLLSDGIVVTRLATGSESNWTGAFGDPQTHQNALPDGAGVTNVEMVEITGGEVSDPSKKGAESIVRRPAN
jgi:hypothetical protein